MKSRYRSRMQEMSKENDCPNTKFGYVPQYSHHSHHNKGYSPVVTTSYPYSPLMFNSMTPGYSPIFVPASPLGYMNSPVFALDGPPLGGPSIFPGIPENPLEELRRLKSYEKSRRHHRRYDVPPPRKPVAHSSSTCLRIMGEDIGNMSLIELAFDAKRNRYLQQRIAKIKADGKISELRYMFHQVLPDTVRMSCNEYANFVVQRLLENIDKDLLAVMVDHIKKDVFTLATHPYACRVLQVILTHARMETRLKLFRALQPDVEELLMNNFGCYVLQKVVETCGAENLQLFMKDSILPRAFDLCVHKTSTRVIQEIFRYFPHDDKAEITQKLLENLVNLCKDNYGNYVVEKMVHYGSQDTREQVVNILIPSVVDLACTKTGSNILEKCLMKFNAAMKAKLVTPLVEDPDKLAQMIGDQYGNYVIQQMVTAMPYRNHDFTNAVREHFAGRDQADLTRYEMFVHARVREQLLL